MKKYLLLSFVIFPISILCQTKEDSLALAYFKENSNWLLMKPTELSGLDSTFIGHSIWHISSKNCPEYCYEDKNIQLILKGDSIFWMENNVPFFSSKFVRLHKKSGLYSNYVIYEYTCNKDTYRIYVTGVLQGYYLLECYKIRRFFKSNLKRETLLVIKKIAD